MQRDRWGGKHETPTGTKNQELFDKALESFDPALIVADGMTVLYGLHGLDTNDNVSTDIITTWAKKLTRNGLSTVIIIDHTAKGAERGSTPIGSGHKQAMVQGTMIQVWPTRQPMPDADGEVELIVLKDRPGQVRKISVKSGGKAQLAAIVGIDSRVKDVTTIRIQAPPDPNSPTQTAAQANDLARRQAHKAEEEIVRALYGDVLGTSFSSGEIFTALGLSRDGDGKWAPAADHKKWVEALKRLIAQGWIYTDGNTRAKRYVLALSENDAAGVSIDLSGAGSD
jgi:hypothetical protein